MAEEIRAKLILEGADKADQQVKKVAKSTEDLNNEAKGAIGNFQVMGVSINGLKSAFSKAIPMAKGLFSTVKAGIAATGIGLLLLAVGSLFTFFTKTKVGAEALSVAFKGVGAAISVITDRISAIGGAIVKVFKGDFKGAAEEAKGALSGLGAEIVKETKAAIRLERVFQRLKDEERAFSKERALTNREIAEARLIAEDETKSLEDRMAALQRANELEISTADKAIEMQRQKTEAKREEVALGESLAEDLDALAAEEVKLIDLQTQSFKTRKRLATALETLKVEHAAAEKSRQKEAEKAAADADKALEEQRKEEDKAAEELAIKRASEADELRVRQEELVLLSIENAEQLALKELEFKMDAELRAVEGKENAEEQKLLIQQKYTKLRNNLANAEAQFSMQSAMQSADVVKGTLGSLASSQVQGTKKWKNLKIAEATISGLQASINAFKSTAEIPVLGAALAPIAAAAALLATQQNISSIKSTPIPEQTLAAGGIVGGYGTGTSDSVRARLSKGETVINAKSSKMFLPLLSQMNAAGGGDDFAASGNTAQQADNGGSVIKAYVLSDDMSSDQDRLNKIRRRASL